MSDIERREACELRAVPDGRTPGRLAGHAAIFNSESRDLGGFTEIIRPGAFKRSLESNSADPLALVAHIPHMVLGRRSAGTLRLSEDARGLAFEIELPDTQAARDLAVSVARGDIKGASFGFTVPHNGARWEQRGGRIVRELLDVELREISLTSSPAYEDTTVARRALESLLPRPRLAIARRWLETI